MLAVRVNNVVAAARRNPRGFLLAVFVFLAALILLYSLFVPSPTDPATRDGASTFSDDDNTSGGEDINLAEVEFVQPKQQEKPAETKKQPSILGQNEQQPVKQEEKKQPEKPVEQKPEEKKPEEKKPPAKEEPVQENKKPKGTEGVTIGIVDEHDDVLHFWLEAASEEKIPKDGNGLGLIHIDTHSDAGIPNDITQPMSKIGVQIPDSEKLREMTTIGDFIPAAQYLGMVNNKVVWVSSNWPTGGYNFEIGDHTITLASREVQSDNHKPLMCYVKNDKSDEATDAAASLNAQAPGYLRKTCFNAEKVKVERETLWSVIPLDKQTEIKIENVLGEDMKSYILDIDEDFFAATSPTFEHFVKVAEYGALFKAFEEIVKPETEICVSKPEDNLKLTRVFQDMFWNGYMFIPGSKEPLIVPTLPLVAGEKPKQKPLVSYTPEILDLWCKKDREYAYQALIKVSQIFSLMMKNIDYLGLHFLRTEGKFPTYSPLCTVNTLFGVCSSGDPSNPNPPKSEIANKVEQIGEIINNLGALPAVITIARSSEGYTSAHLLPFIEEKLISVLKNAVQSLGARAEVKYLPGLSPAKPIDKEFYGVLLDPKEVDSVKKKAFAMKEQEAKTYIKARQVQVRNVMLVALFSEQNEIPNISSFTDKFKEFKAWKKELLDQIRKKAIEMKESEEKEGDDEEANQNETKKEQPKQEEKKEQSSPKSETKETEKPKETKETVKPQASVPKSDNKSQQKETPKKEEKKQETPKPKPAEKSDEKYSKSPTTPVNYDEEDFHGAPKETNGIDHDHSQPTTAKDPLEVEEELPSEQPKKETKPAPEPEKKPETKEQKPAPVKPVEKPAEKPAETKPVEKPKQTPEKPKSAEKPKQPVKETQKPAKKPAPAPAQDFDEIAAAIADELGYGWQGNVNPTKNYCYHAIMTRNDPDLEAASCWIDELQKTYNKELHHNGERVNVELVLKAPGVKFVKFMSEKQTLLSKMAETKADAQAFSVHEGITLFYEQVDCSADRTKYIGSTAEFIQVVKDRHQDLKGNCRTVTE